MNEIIRTQVRIPKVLRDWLRKQAKQANRSMNGELVELIKREKERTEQLET